MSSSNPNITSVLKETRTFPPSKEFVDKAFINAAEHDRLTKWAREKPDEFWAEAAKSLHWFKPWTKVLEWNEPFAKWFVGGTLNASYNCLDRHALGSRAEKPAILFEGEPGDTRRITYAQLHKEVCNFANVLKELGIQKGDR